mmetsp:Transcript_67496/g.188332  ORF Transcript_67496/g.188332 Transcript_67496/m.188332 type:complete len:311 (-) Transcript_67496:351-1283(-)
MSRMRNAVAVWPHASHALIATPHVTLFIPTLPASITPRSSKACVNRSRFRGIFVQAPIAALKMIDSVATRSRCMSLNEFKALTHLPALRHTLSTSLDKIVSISKRLRSIVPSTSNAISHLTLSSQALITALQPMTFSSTLMRDIESINANAHAHLPRLSQALIVALHAMVFTSTPSVVMVLRRLSAVDHSPPPRSQALTAAEYVQTLGRTSVLPCVIALKRHSTIAHRPLFSQALAVALKSMVSISTPLLPLKSRRAAAFTHWPLFSKASTTAPQVTVPASVAILFILRRNSRALAQSAAFEHALTTALK